MSFKQQIANSIKWIDALDPKNGFKKTAGALGHLDKEYPKDTWKTWFDVKDLKVEGKFCCLGVACVLNDIKTFVDPADVTEREYPVFMIGYDKRLGDILGLYNAGIFKSGDMLLEDRARGKDPRGYHSIMEVNDLFYSDDKDFTNMHRFILDNLEEIFHDQVAKGLRKHYSRKGS